jgi:hypothetical protein
MKKISIFILSIFLYSSPAFSCDDVMLAITCKAKSGEQATYNVPHDYVMLKGKFGPAPYQQQNYGYVAWLYSKIFPSSREEVYYIAEESIPSVLGKMHIYQGLIQPEKCAEVVRYGAWKFSLRKVVPIIFPFSIFEVKSENTEYLASQAF